MGHQELFHGAAGQDGNVQVQRRLGQPCGQRIAAGHMDTALVQRQLFEVSHQTLGHIQERRQGLGGAEKMLQIGVRRVEHHAHEGDGFEWGFQARHVSSQATDVIRRGQDGAANLRATRYIGVVVGVERGDELHLGVALEKLDHLGTVLNEGIHRSRIKEPAGLLHHVLAHRLSGVSRVLLASMGVKRNPQHPSRQGGGATKHRFFFEHHHIQAAFLGCDGGGQTCSP